MKILSGDYTKIVVYDCENHKEIAVITDNEIITAKEKIMVKLTPVY